MNLCFLFCVRNSLVSFVMWRNNEDFLGFKRIQWNCLGKKNALSRARIPSSFLPFLAYNGTMTFFSPFIYFFCFNLLALFCLFVKNIVENDSFFFFNGYFIVFYVLYTNIQVMWSCVFFSLLNPYACPSHLSNYLLTWNTLLAADFFFFYFPLHLSCVSQTVPPARMYRRAPCIALGENPFANVEEIFTRSEFDPNRGIPQFRHFRSFRR